jgi:hypothetical protein
MYCVVVTVTEQKHHGVFFIKQARFVSSSVTSASRIIGLKSEIAFAGIV